MVSSSFKITFLGAAAIALLALCHAKDKEEPSILTYKQIEARGEDYAARILKPTKTYYQCRSDCYNDALRSTLGKNFWGIISKDDKKRYGKEVDRVDSCVADLIDGFRTFDKIVKYEEKRRFHEITVSQYCVDEVIDDGTAKVPFHRIPEVQVKLAACSLDQCDGPYLHALKIAAEDAINQD
ncbi:MAG: hypothetical protein J3R72DRAFT_103195 [Linnemannia gamsii]|nr:MAG: hypothetical protein J3R72DRAFT_103195 [Linnemannia gamsii]